MGFQRFNKAEAMEHGKRDELKIINNNHLTEMSM